MEGTDCLGCRIASGGGLLLAGVYVYNQASTKTKFNKAGMIAISLGFGALGFARLCNLYPFSRKS